MRIYRMICQIRLPNLQLLDEFPARGQSRRDL
jgi:hypothetical protein